MTSHSKAPVTVFCPNPACGPVMAQANDYVLGKLAGRLATDYTPLFASVAYQELRAQLTEALVSGDLDATKAHCRAWCKLVIAWTEQQPPVPAPPLVTTCAHEWLKCGSLPDYCFRCDSAKEAA